MTSYITTPIYYVNAEPHLGHAYTTIIADTYSRFRRLCGDDVRFQTGTDEHGDKIAEAASKQDVEPRQYADRISNMFRSTWPLLHCEPDYFIRTTDSNHIQTVQKILQDVYDRGDIYFDEYTGLYCRGCERFLTEKELVDGNCPDHQQPPQEIAEKNYFFRMSKYQQQLIDHIHAHPEFITPERYRNEVLSFLSEPLEDLCISRPKSRLTWGIELPFDKNFVTYVWFDALINYLTGIGYPDSEQFAKYWPVAEHLIAKDILKPHAIYWPTMLMAMGLKPYTRLHVHGYWNVNETKMSKSLGNVVRPKDMVDAFGVDPFRYFLLREMSFGLDASFSHEAIISRRNSDLANDIGNLYSRSAAMIQKYTGGRIPEPSVFTDSDRELEQAAIDMLRQYRESMADFQFHRGLQAVWEVISLANKYIVTNEPWVLAKSEETLGRLHTVLYELGEILRILTLVLRPVMPETAGKMAHGLGLDAGDPLVTSLSAGGTWGVLPPGTQMNSIEALFPRIEVVKPEKVEKPQKAENKAKVVAGANVINLIELQQVRDVEIRVAEIVAAEKVKKSDKLLKLTVLVPEERTIVAGIAEHYQPEDLIGTQVLVVANLKPAKLMGIPSQGMVLAAKFKHEGKDRLVLTGVRDRAENGSLIS